MLFAARSAVALYRLLDVAPVFAGDDRITRVFALVPGSDFGADALGVIDSVGGRLVPWSEAEDRTFDLVLAASPKGDLGTLRGPQVLLPHGAGFNKSIPGEGSADSASGLDPEYLLSPGGVPPALHALAHPGQVARLAAVSARAAERAKVIGDPTLERILASASLRDGYRAALGTRERRLIVLTSTWGPDCLLRRRPGLAAELTAQLPYDEYQLALIVHPNERSLLGTYELTERLAPALGAGLVLAGPHEEWASVLVAADALVTDHGSTALYFCAADDRPVVSVHRDSVELLPGTPMDQLLGHIPELDAADSIEQAIGAYRVGAGRRAARSAFAARGSALSRLRTEVYAVLGLTPPSFEVPPRLLPSPAPAPRTPAAFDVQAQVSGDVVRIRRHPVGGGAPGHHLAAEHGAVGEPVARSAGLLYRRALRPDPAGQSAGGELAWTAEGWTRHALAEYPGCRTAAAVPTSGPCLLRMRGRQLPYAVRIEPRYEGGRVVRPDPAAALSAAHAWLISHGDRTVERAVVTCLIGERAFGLVLCPATAAEAGQVV